MTVTTVYFCGCSVSKTQRMKLSKTNEEKKVAETSVQVGRQEFAVAFDDLPFRGEFVNHALGFALGDIMGYRRPHDPFAWHWVIIIRRRLRADNLK